MHSFLLRLAGIDEFILAKTKNEKSTGFLLCGWAVLVFFVLNFLSTGYLLSFLVHDFWMDVMIALAYSTIVFNFYRFTLSSILWRSSNFRELENVQPPTLATTAIRFLACGFFILIMSKPIELYLFHSAILKYLDTGMLLKEKLYEDFALLHQHYPLTWFITAIFLFIFLWPVYYRSYSSKWDNKEYEVLHFSFLMNIVKQEYLWFKDQYNEIFRQLKINSQYRTQYSNAPFNTELNEIIVNTKGRKMKEGTNKEFYDLLDSLPTEK